MLKSVLGQYFIVLFLKFAMVQYCIALLPKSVLSQRCFVWYSIVLLFLKSILVQYSFVFEICIGMRRHEMTYIVSSGALNSTH